MSFAPFCRYCFPTSQSYCYCYYYYYYNYRLDSYTAYRSEILAGRRVREHVNRSLLLPTTRWVIYYYRSLSCVHARRMIFNWLIYDVGPEKETGPADRCRKNSNGGKKQAVGIFRRPQQNNGPAKITIFPPTSVLKIRTRNSSSDRPSEVKKEKKKKNFTKTQCHYTLFATATQ